MRLRIDSQNKKRETGGNVDTGLKPRDRVYIYAARAKESFPLVSPDMTKTLRTILSHTIGDLVDKQGAGFGYTRDQAPRFIRG
ncbi:hypothetical protein BST65_14090 [Bradyrhizobium canariense]|nr:hypothetical protein BST65_14090 [Bradyrhizobium canariense]OSI51402.1 hypothetical protein BSZ20_04700 [Bradyrhizobium canariense]OSI54117.1 hypothetical protein BST67_07625 [Bradyrhizobium canariense]OSI57638.1 hypothetical protein BSZ15_12725 [Bradyrhizobium canariense]